MVLSADVRLCHFLDNDDIHVLYMCICGNL